MSEDEVAAAAAVVIAVVSKQKQQKRKRRKHWVKSWLSRRLEHGIYETLLSELRLEDESNYKNYLRMTPILILVPNRSIAACRRCLSL